ncbi:MAG: helix-turn-helix domain-containing protein [bacterium]|nr:helix-turn-helix domain-containing protein [bacterium]
MKQELKDPSKSISEVAYNVGFTNLSYFTRSFKQEFGKLPSDVR